MLEAILEERVPLMGFWDALFSFAQSLELNIAQIHSCHLVR